MVPPITTPRAILSQLAQRVEYVEAPPPNEEVMGTRRPSREPKSAPYIDEWLSWGKGASLRARKGRGHVESHPPKGGMGKQGDSDAPRVGKGQASQAHNLHQYLPGSARQPSLPLPPPTYTPRRFPLQEKGQKGALHYGKGGRWGRRRMDEGDEGVSKHKTPPGSSATPRPTPWV